MPPVLESLASNQPFGTSVVDWLWERKEELPGMLLVVPGAQAGRRIRQALAERGGVLAPRIVTSGYFLHTGEGASEAAEILAWMEILEGISDWSDYSAAFPEAPSQSGSAWSLALAKVLAGVRAGLIEGALTMSSAAKRMAESVEKDRWLVLTELEGKVDALLKSWGYESRNHLVARASIDWPAGVEEIVLAGMVDLSPALISIFKKSPIPIRLLASNTEEIDEWGRPQKEWATKEISWPESPGGVTLVGDPLQQAEAALRKVAEEESPSNEIVLGSLDDEVSAELARVFGRRGWILHNPASQRKPALAPWLGAWRRYLAKPTAAHVIDLLGFPQTGRMVNRNRVNRTRALSSLRNDHGVRTAEDIERLLPVLEKEVEETKELPRGKYRQKALEQALLSQDTFQSLAKSKGRFLRGSFHEAMKSLIPDVDEHGESGATEWLEATAELAQKIDRPASFWLELLQSSLAPISDPAPESRVGDVLGWLELSFATGKQLVICGVNEGMVPARASTDSWLPEGTRRLLELSNNETRSARDAYLLHSLIASRANSGRVDLILGKSSATGDVLQPSRLLLAASGDELAARVQELFREVPPPESGLAWEKETKWLWKVSKKGPPESLNVTAFTDYLACPFRFYLKQVLRMRESDPERGEWSSQDFGTLMHLVLENFGRDEEARLLSSAGEITKWTHGELDRLLVERSGGMTATMRIQQEVMKQRLEWFSIEQEAQFAEGWRITEVEKDFEVEIDGMKIRGQIDRVEQREGSKEIRILDYKTKATTDPVAGAHYVRYNAGFEWPAHLEEVEEVRAEFMLGKNPKPTKVRWKNLQVPLYAMAMEDAGPVAEIGYFGLGSSEQNTKVEIWADFDDGVREASLTCAKWIVEQVRAGVFWPPAEKVKYDDYDPIRFGKPLTEVIDAASFPYSV